jgi:phosphate transport system substrate-binding protein
MQFLSRLLLACIAQFILGAAALSEPQPVQHVQVVGSSTAYPIITAAAEQFGRDSHFATPVIESTGTGGGFKLFCAGIDLNTPDIVMASRPIKHSERRSCEKNLVSDIAELRIGYDGIVIANRLGAAHYRFSRDDIYHALARWVSSASGSLVRNPYRRWREVNPDLPDEPIRVFGPPPTSGTRDILVERLMTRACLDDPAMRELHEQDPGSFLRQCQALREDGAYINAGENDTRLVRMLINDPHALGIFGYNFLDQNRDRLQAASIDGITPGFDSIESGSYSLSRPLYLYLKKQHVGQVPGLQEFIDYVTSDASVGVEGRLLDKGLIPLRKEDTGPERNPSKPASG